MKKDIRFVQGNEACVEAAMYAGLDFFAGYPITPSTEIAELLSYRLPIKGGKFIQMEDELSSMCAIIGASLTGKKVMTATSGPGFSLKQEAIGFAVMTETPCVIVNVQRGGPSTGLPTSGSQGDIMQARWGTHGEHSIIALTASNNQDLFAMTVEAFNLSETFRTPVILLLDEVVAHTRERLIMPKPGEINVVERLKTSVPEGTDFHPYLPREDGRLPMSVVENRRARGEKLGLLELNTLWPFPSDIVRKRCACVNNVLVVEMNMGQILHEVKNAVAEPDKVFLANKIDGSFITPTDILNILRVIQGKGV